MRAEYADSTIAVYQAYPQEIAEPALRARTFVAPFKRERMTWVIKPRSQPLSVAGDEGNGQVAHRYRELLWRDRQGPGARGVPGRHGARAAGGAGGRAAVSAGGQRMVLAGEVSSPGERLARSRECDFPSESVVHVSPALSGVTLRAVSALLSAEPT
ncbi:DUF4291 family protein [Streptomyces sp. NBC_00005]|uniref:DUF4291 family protein n=1 Tax=Streptomyces sp. NBC_00005 TaxID=2903609 RepID=UPI003869BE1C